MTPPASSAPMLRTHQVLSACLVMGEPSLDELLAEPIVLVRMKSAGGTAQEVWGLCERVRETLRGEIGQHLGTLKNEGLIPHSKSRG